MTDENIRQVKEIEKMGKVKEIYVEIKKSRSFQTHTAGMLINELENKTYEQVEIARKFWMAKCRKAVMEQIKLD